MSGAFEEAAMANFSKFDQDERERAEDRVAASGASEAGAAEFSAVFPPMYRRAFLQTTAAAAALAAMPRWAQAHPGEFDAIRAEIEKRHDESVKRLQNWIRQPSIAAENRNHIHAGGQLIGSRHTAGERVLARGFPIEKHLDAACLQPGDEFRDYVTHVGVMAL
jgi:hypothetical protein